MMNVLAADIGGTKSWISLVKLSGENKQQVLFEKVYQSRDFANASALISTFLQQASAAELTIDHMCLALPGVVSKRHAGLTNLDWQLDADALQTEFAIQQATFINDFEAAALGVNTLCADDFVTLNEGKPEDEAIKVVTGAGTGLGLAWLNYAHGGYRANATEGGHADFAPVNAQQIALLQELLGYYSHVSTERLLSGDGLQRIYGFLNRSTKDIPHASEITAMAESGDTLAQQTLALFIEIYGAYIGNLAVLFKPLGGIYIAGGIASRILPWMQSPQFLGACFNKGRMHNLVERIPVYLVTNERLGLQGALSVALAG